MSKGSASSQNENHFLKGLAFALLATVLWSGNFIVARALHKSISPVSLAFFRWLIATLFLLLIAYKNLRSEWRLVLPHAKPLCFAALTGVTLFNTFIYIAGRYSSAMNLALIGTTAAPVFVLLISGLVLRQKISLAQIIGALLCLAGILFLISKGNIGQLSKFRFSVGDLWIFGAALAFAIYTILVRKNPKEISATTFLFTIFFLGTLFLFPAYLVELGNGRTIEWSSTNILVFLYLGIGASVIAFLSWNISIRAMGPTRTALFGNLIPVFSSIEAVLILNEKFSWVTVLSLAIILIGIGVANANVLFVRR
jgi:drug/metabolite transporter (DMT)-like permease